MKQEILSRVDIYDYISGFIALKEKSRGQYLGLCPFHHEKTPSFSVNRDKQFFYCFGCKAGGDVVKFTMMFKSMPFDVAIKTIADECGISLSTADVEASDKVYLEINKYFAEECHRLMFDPRSHYGIDYMRARGIRDEVLRQYMLGYLPLNKTDDILKNLSNNFSQAAIIESGLFKLSKEKGLYSPFMGRIIFPIYKNAKSIVGFGSRIIKNDASSVKYLNSSESDWFHKSNLLYGIEQISQTSETIFVVEGYMDVVSLANSGLPNAVAVLGASLSEVQMKRLWRYTNKPTICFDNDKAGRSAMASAAKKVISLIEPGKSLSFFHISGCKDPDEFVRDKGAEGFISTAAKEKISLADYIYNSLSGSTALDNPDDIALLRQSLNELCDTIHSPDLKNEYKKYFDKLLYASSRYKPKQLAQSNLQPISLQTAKKNNEIEIEKEICKIIAENKDLLLDQEMLDEFMDCHFQSEYGNNMRLDLTREIHDYTQAEVSENIRKRLKCLFLSLKISNLQRELAECDKDESFDAKMLELKKHQIELQKQLSSKLI